jgi:hypothetical protein
VKGIVGLGVEAVRNASSSAQEFSRLAHFDAVISFRELINGNDKR